MPLVQRLVCLLCDSQGPLRRLKPEKLYACADCFKNHGGARGIVGNLYEHIVAFNERHKPKKTELSFSANANGIERISIL